jgi:hypothetical protein
MEIKFNQEIKFLRIPNQISYRLPFGKRTKMLIPSLKDLIKI